MRPMPPNWRTTSGPHPKRPKCRRLGVLIWMDSLISSGSGLGRCKTLAHGRIVNVAVQEREGSTLPRTASLVDQNCQLLELGEHLVERKELGTGRQDRGFDHGMPSPIEAEEVAQPALGGRFSNDRRPFFPIIQLGHSKLVITAGVQQNSPGNHVSRPRGGRG